MLVSAIIFTLAALLATGAPTSRVRNPPTSNFHNVYNCNNKGQVAMTFDDGPFQYERQVANQMNGGKATFFLNGNNYACIYDRADDM
jgi:peptidoglycan/xylan/chitin deacetylase (PgdA/CDA1 family)